LTGEPEEIAAALKGFYAPVPDTIEGSSNGGNSRFAVPPPPKPLKSEITALSVSAFKSYLQCPYRFYLKHILKLRRHDDSAYELSPLDFGVLAHDVLRNFALSPAAGSTAAGDMEAFLGDELARLARARFGSDALPVVFVQHRQLVQRFKNFARWQAARTALGWRIAHAELEIEPGTVQLELSQGSPMTVVGRIDRIDHNPRTGEWAIFDYKVSDGELDAKKAHLHPSKGWLDLQLPLYHLAFTKTGLGTSAELGYILLSASGDEGVSVAEFNAAELEDAVARAVAIAEAVRREVFWPPTDEQLVVDDFAALCGVAQFQAAQGGAP
jgi:RecB family exonuclease